MPPQSKRAKLSAQSQSDSLALSTAASSASSSSESTDAFGPIDAITQSMLAAASNSAHVIMSRNISESTRATYKQKIAHIEAFYASIKQNLFPLDVSHMIAFLGQLNNPLLPDKTKKVSTMQSYKSALKWYCKEQGKQMEKEFEATLNQFMAGFRNTIAILKQDGVLPLNEGKSYLTFPAYKHLADCLFLSPNHKSMRLTWPFIILQWNLIARSASVAAIMYGHIRWDQDALLIDIPKHKSDQAGDKRYPRHLYANPSNPVICPILALAVVTFSQPIRQMSDGSSSFRLFDGEHSEARFSALLRTALSSLSPASLALIGTDIKDIGTHSTRKGAASYCVSMPNGPSTIQILLRAGWSIGNVLDRYIFGGSGGDQLTGRVLAGLDFENVNFSTLPPHFHGGLTGFDLASVCPLFPTFTTQFKQVVPYLLASLVYHEQWLRSKLSCNHPLFTSSLFASGCTARLKPFVHCGTVRCVDDQHTMIASGIPPHLAIVNRLHAMEDSANQSRDALMRKVDELPVKVADSILSRVQVNGAVPVTAHDITRIMESMIERFRAEFSHNPSNPLPGAVVVSEAANLPFDSFTWGGRIQMVPCNWKFPSINVKDCWYLWNFGYYTTKPQDGCCSRVPCNHGTSLHIQPLRFLVASNLTTKACGILLCRAKKLMMELKTLAPPPSFEGLPPAEISNYFDPAFKQLVERAFPGITSSKRRWVDMSIHTLYKALCSKKRRRESSEEDSANDSE